jgi:hypothetical protein
LVENGREIDIFRPKNNLFGRVALDKDEGFIWPGNGTAGGAP